MGKVRERLEWEKSASTRRVECTWRAARTKCASCDVDHSQATAHSNYHTWLGFKTTGFYSSKTTRQFRWRTIYEIAKRIGDSRKYRKG